MLKVFVHRVIRKYTAFRMEPVVTEEETSGALTSPLSTGGSRAICSRGRGTAVCPACAPSRAPA